MHDFTIAIAILCAMTGSCVQSPQPVVPWGDFCESHCLVNRACHMEGHCDNLAHTDYNPCHVVCDKAPGLDRDAAAEALRPDSGFEM